MNWEYIKIGRIIDQTVTLCIIDNTMNAFSNAGYRNIMSVRITIIESWVYYQAGIFQCHNRISHGNGGFVQPEFLIVNTRLRIIIKTKTAGSEFTTNIKY